MEGLYAIASGVFIGCALFVERTWLKHAFLCAGLFVFAYGAYLIGLKECIK